MAKQIEGLPEGWVWIYDGQETWINSKGQRSTARHALNLKSGETLSVRQVQNTQAETKRLLGKEQKPKRNYNVREGVVYTKKREDSYRGQTVSYSFNNLAALYEFIFDQRIPANYFQFTIQTRFKSSKIPGKNYDRYKNGKRLPRYASLSKFFPVDEPPTDEEFNEIFAKADEFNYDGESRFYIYATEF